MRRVLFIAVLCAAPLAKGAELEAQRAPLIAAATPAVRARSKLEDVETRWSVYSDSSKRSASLDADDRMGSSAVRRGALIGAGVGLLAGAAGGIWAAASMGCKTGGEKACRTRDRQFGYIASASAVGLGVGAVMGATIGKLVSVVRHTLTD